jgi:hypothetical protein
MEQLHVLIMLDMRWDVPRFLKVGPQSRRHRMCVEHLWTMEVPWTTIAKSKGVPNAPLAMHCEGL